ncbi:MAG: hypothetical protein HKN22_03815, partial [Bacteroidia bacterium]|nr:hypothetical protein [Bacteroidia bacterium]
MNTFSKVERLSSQKQLDDLVRNGKRIHVDPFLSYLKVLETNSNRVQVAFS